MSSSCEILTLVDSHELLLTHASAVEGCGVAN